MTTLAVAREYHRAWTTTKDFDSAAGLLADGLETDLPLNVHETKAAFVAAISGFGGLITRVQMLSATASDDTAVLIYDLEMTGLGALRMVEQCTVTDGQITFIRQIHDTAALRQEH